MSPTTPQGKLGLKMLGVVLASIAVIAVVLAVRDKEVPVRRLSGVTVASITFDTPTDAWVSTTGRKALVRDGDAYRLAAYGPGGETGSAAVDEVSVLDDHRVYELDGGVLVIDQTQYSLVDGAYVSGDCYWCSHPFPDQPVVADLHEGHWKVTVGTTVTTLAQPDGWDGSPPTAGLDPAGKVVIVAALKNGDTVIVDGLVCSVKGAWTFVGAFADGMLLHRVDADRRDYSVSKFERCS
jgi:hypothetical protein